MNEILYRDSDSVLFWLNHGKIGEVDAADWGEVSKYHWTAFEGTTKTKPIWYASSRVDDRSTSLHRFLMPGIALVDHKDGDGLNCRRDNLRPATASQNAFNRIKIGTTSRFYGVSRSSKGKWQTKIRVNGERIYLGVFGTEEEAYAARLAAEQKYYPDFERKRE